MMNVKHISFRIITTLAAIGISSLLVYALSHAGRSTKGPIENAMEYTGDVIKNVEQKLIVENREEKRSDKLKWLQPYTENKKLLTHPNKILMGAFDNEAMDSYDPVVAVEDSLTTTFPLIHIYTAWGSKHNERFPTDQVNSIADLGSIPVITWEPWLSDFSQEEFPSAKEDRNKGGMKDVADGAYDTYIRKWAQAAKKVNKPFFLRLGHEMNDGYRYPWGPHNNTPQDFIAAWRHTHDIFTSAGAKNVIWVWSPHPAYEFREFYPGNDYVDYIGCGTLNYGTVAAWSKWWSFKDIFGKFYDSVAEYRKPIMITEFGSLAVGGNRAKWYAAALDSMPQRYPLVKSIIFFHFSKDNTTTQQTLNWYFKDEKNVTSAITRAVNKWHQ